MQVKVVSGYVPLTVRNCSKEQFKQLGRLLWADVEPVAPIRMFDDYPLDKCWAYKFINSLGFEVLPSCPNPPADRFSGPYNMLESNIVMHQKQEWVAQAALEDPNTDVFVWIDYGVFKQENMMPGVVTRFIERLKATPQMDFVTAPGIREAGPIDDTQSWDRFCGSVVIIPASKVFRLHRAMKRRAMQSIIDTHKITIESNTLAHVEWLGDIHIRWYKAWWGAPMFDNYH